MTPAAVIAHHQRMGKPVPAELLAMVGAAHPAVLQGLAAGQDALAVGGRPRHEAGRMNQTEARHLREIIQPAEAAGELVWWRFEEMKFRLANRTWYTPDFVMQLRNGRLLVHEVKGGHWEDDARVKVKVFAEQFPHITVRVWQWTKSGWKVEEF